MFNPLPLAIAAVIATVVWLAMRRGRVDVAEAQRLMAEGARIVDVRMPSEFARGHLPGAQNWPLPSLRTWARQAAQPDDAIIVYCHSGARSGLAARALRASGFKRVYDLGPLDRWPHPAMVGEAMVGEATVAGTAEREDESGSLN